MQKTTCNSLIINPIPCGGGGGKLSYTQLVPEIFPDSGEVTIPPNIVPLNFSIPSCLKSTVLFCTDNFSFEITSGKKGSITTPVSKGKKLSSSSAGKQIKVSLSAEEAGSRIACKLFHIDVANEPIDPYIVYRFIEPGYLQTEADQTISSLVYPSWHPSGKFMAFSVNKTTQDFHPTQRVEVFGLASDVIVYDIEEQVILPDPAVFSESNFEIFPPFQVHGKMQKPLLSHLKCSES